MSDGNGLAPRGRRRRGHPRHHPARCSSCAAIASTPPPTGSTGSSACARASRRALVILDLMMPGMNGEEFRAAQLRDRELAAVPVIVLSGAGRLSEKTALAGTQVVAKPIDLQELFAIVERFCTAAP